MATQRNPRQNMLVCERWTTASRASPITGADEQMAGALYNAAVDLLASERGQQAAQEVVTAFDRDNDYHSEDKRTPVVEFTKALKYSPVIVVDYTMMPAQAGRWHPGEWISLYTTPRIHSVLGEQSISINALWLTEVVLKKRKALQDLSTLDALYLAEFPMLVMLIHEITLMMVDWLSEYRHLEYERLHGLGLRYPNKDRAGREQYGRMMETYLFGGPVEFYEETIGAFPTPWICYDTMKAVRPPIFELVQMMTYERNAIRATAIIGERPVSIERDWEHVNGEERPFVQGMICKKSCIMTVREKYIIDQGDALLRLRSEDYSWSEWPIGQFRSLFGNLESKATALMD